MTVLLRAMSWCGTRHPTDMLVAGGWWSVAGEWWSVVGVRWPVVGGRFLARRGAGYVLPTSKRLFNPRASGNHEKLEGREGKGERAAIAFVRAEVSAFICRTSWAESKDGHLRITARSSKPSRFSVANPSSISAHQRNQRSFRTLENGGSRIFRRVKHEVCSDVKGSMRQAIRDT